MEILLKKILVGINNNMIYIIKQEGLYQNKVNSSLVSNCNSVTVKWATRRVCAW